MVSNFCQNRDLTKHDFFIPYMVEIVIQLLSTELLNIEK